MLCLLFALAVPRLALLCLFRQLDPVLDDFSPTPQLEQLLPSLALFPHEHLFKLAHLAAEPAQDEEVARGAVRGGDNLAADELVRQAQLAVFERLGGIRRREDVGEQGVDRFECTDGLRFRNFRQELFGITKRKEPSSAPGHICTPARGEVVLTSLSSKR